MEKILNFFKHPITISFIILTLLTGGIYLALKYAPTESNGESAPYTERFWGREDSKIVVTIYSDLQCSFCKQFNEQAEPQLKEKYSNDIKFVYKHFPLGIHEFAQEAAEATEAAGEQGKFWEFKDLLFSRQSESNTWTRVKLTEYAKELGLDSAKFKSRLDTNYFKKAVETTTDEAVNKKIGGTPTVFINDKQITLTTDYFDSVEKEILALKGN